MRKLIYSYALLCAKLADSGNAIGGLTLIALLSPIYLALTFLVPEMNTIVAALVTFMIIAGLAGHAKSRALDLPKNPSHSNP